MSDTLSGNEPMRYSLWTAPQSAWAELLDGVEIRLPEAAADSRGPDPELEARKRAFATAVDPEALIRVVYR